MTARGIDFTGIVYLAALAAGAFVVYKLVTQGPAAAGEAISKGLDRINPTNPENIFALTANSVTQAVSSDPHTTFGAKLWEWLHPDQVKRERAMFAQEAVQAAESARVKPDATGGTWRASYTDYTGSMGEQIPLIGDGNFSPNFP